MNTGLPPDDAFKLALKTKLTTLKGDDAWADVAAKLEVTPSQISKYLAGITIPSMSLLLRFDELIPGFMTDLFREYARLQKTAGKPATRTRVAREEG